jgi:autotransporter-associated beta strand protein
MVNSLDYRRCGLARFSAFPRLALFAALALSFGGLARATVTVKDNGDGTVTLANNLVSAVISKSAGSISHLYSASLPNVDLLNQGINLELTHIGSGTNDYWTTVAGAGTEVYSVIENTGTMVDVQIRNPTATGDLTAFPNGIWDWSIHQVMFDNDPGLYTYHVWRHNANQPAAYWNADSWQGYTNSALFGSSSYNKGYGYSGTAKFGLNAGGTPPGAPPHNIPQEVAVFPMVNYYCQPTGQYYEPGWPIYTQIIGLTWDLYPGNTKYDWPTYLGPNDFFRNTWGEACDLIGVWHCNGSSEWRNGGPTKLSGAVSGDYLYMDDVEGHGLGGLNTNVAAGQVFTKMVGPFYTYINVGPDHNALWADAQARGAQEVAKWPYAWVNEPESDYPRQRGTVTGQITSTTGQSTAGAVVILGLPVSAAYPDWIWQGCTNYLFWATADAHGNFTIPKVDPGTYTLYSYVPGIFGELIQDNITVTANSTTNVGAINWSPPRSQSLLFQVGIPDHSTQESRFGNLEKQFGLWWRYYTEMGTSDLNFNVGTSDVANDWYYAQTSFSLPDGTYAFPHWNINFNLASVPTNPVMTFDLAGGYGTYFYIYVNGSNDTPSAYNYGGIPTNSGADIYRDVVQIGQFQQYVEALPSTHFKTGSNTITIELRQPGSSGSWTGIRPDLVHAGLMYDAIKLEDGAATTQIIQNGTYKITSGTNGLVMRVQGGSTASGAGIVEWPFQFLSDEEWTITDLGSDIYSIIAGNSGMALSVQGASKAVAAPLVQSPYTGATSQQWHAVLVPGGGISFVNVNSGLAIDIPSQRSDYPNNVQLIQNTPNNSPSQTWFYTAPTFGPPDVATALTASSGNNQVALAWTPSTRATSYVVKRGQSAGQETTVLSATVTGSNYIDTTATNGVPYYYVVSAVTSLGGASVYSNEASVTALPPVPTAPTLYAGPGNGSSVLSWTAPANAATYTVKRGAVSGAETTVVATNVTSLSATDSGLTNGSKYYYVVTASNLSGTSASSNEVSVIPTASVPASVPTLAVLGGDSVASLSWAPIANAASYILVRGTSSGVYTTTFTIPAGLTGYLDSGLTDGVTYYYGLAASNPNGTTSNSNQVSVTPASSPPAAPTGLTATGSNAQVSLAWNAVTNATAYVLVRGTASGVYPTLLSSSGTSRAFTDTGLVNGTPYYYAVQAVTLGGTSGYSTAASATPSRPAGTISWLGGVNVNWDMTTRNWQYKGQTSNYQDGDSLVLGDGPPSTVENLFLTTTVKPGNITINSTTLDYSFAGVGAISGTTGLSFYGNNTSFAINIPATYTGPTLIQSGTLYIEQPGTIGTGNVTMANAGMEADYDGATTIGVPPITATGSNSIVMSPRMNLYQVVGSGTTTIIATGGTYKFENFYGAWGGNFLGTINLTGSGTGTLITGYYRSGFDGNLSKAIVNMDNTRICGYDSSGGNTITFGALNGTGSSSIIGSIYEGGLTVSTGGLNINSEFDGGITDSQNGSGNTTLVKTGTAALILGGSSAYTGPTSVTQGNLTVNGMLSGSGTPVTVSSGASLGGTGSITGSVTVNGGGGLVLSSTGSLAIVGNVVLSGTVSIISPSATLPGGVYPLLTYTGTLSAIKWVWSIQASPASSMSISTAPR